jgi:hypothetical protein
MTDTKLTARRFADNAGHPEHIQDDDMPYELRPAEGGGYVIDSYVYQLSQAGCDAEHTPAGGDWYGLLRGGLDASATAALDMGMTTDEQRFLATRAGAIVSEQTQGAVSVTYYADRATLDAAWRTVTAAPFSQPPRLMLEP